MKYNPFVVTPYRKQPRGRKQCCSQQPVNNLVNGMVTLGSIAVIGGTTVGILGALQK